MVSGISLAGDVILQSLQACSCKSRPCVDNGDDSVVVVVVVVVVVIVVVGEVQRDDRSSCLGQLGAGSASSARDVKKAGAMLYRPTPTVDDLCGCPDPYGTRWAARNSVSQEICSSERIRLLFL
ncbi:unnamed protein product [Polarella glacialis]|uniref:Uncharacterized protein n=1 Tax=Polarella glacialis TaxID=89957 RepID=A0A813L7U9_POLGL|nr:unnamed protein product [Polarella glacialis]